MDCTVSDGALTLFLLHILYIYIGEVKRMKPSEWNPEMKELFQTFIGLFILVAGIITAEYLAAGYMYVFRSHNPRDAVVMYGLLGCFGIALAIRIIFLI